MMVENEFIDYKQALALKRLGFNEKCFGFYNELGNYIDEKNKTNSNCNKPDMKGKYCTAPLYQQVFMWAANNNNNNNNKLHADISYEGLSDVNNLILEVFILDMSGCIYKKRDKDFKLLINGDLGNFDNYTEAKVACIDKIIEILQYEKE